MSRKRTREDPTLSAEEDAQLFHAGPHTEGGLLQLQANELVAARAVHYAQADGFDAVLGNLKQELFKLPERTLSATNREVHQYLDLLGMPQRPLRFHPPANVRLVGSWAAETAAQPLAAVDVAVEMPRMCFDEKDHLNHRYFARRAQYLGELATALRKRPAFKRLSWEYLGHDVRKPVLVIQPQLKGHDAPLDFAIRLIPTIAPGTFPLQKLAPDRNCVRPASNEAAALDGAHEQAQLQQAQRAQQLPPTPLYNAALLQDMLVDVQQKALQDAITSVPQLREAIVLLKVWARAQRLEWEPDSFNGFLLSMLAAHLAVSGTVTPAMNPLQAARAVMQVLGKESTFSKGVVMKRLVTAAAGAQPPAATVFRERHETVFIDPSGFLNLAAHVSKSGRAQAQEAAQRAVALLDHPTDALEVFEAVFLTPQPRGAAYDAFWRVSVPLPEGSGVLAGDSPAFRELEGRVEALARQALGQRAKAVRAFRLRLEGTPHPAGALPPAGANLMILLASQMDPATAHRAQDVGPPLDSPDAAAFLAFWGEDIAEKTRFQDGYLAYAVTWMEPGSASASRHAIADRALAHALIRHLGPGAEVSGHADLLDDALVRKGTPPDALANAHRAITGAVRSLTTKLRAAGSLPLRIVSVQPLSAAVRDTAAFPPLPHPLAAAGPAAGAGTGRMPRCLEPLELAVQLEGSGRWPDHPEAFLKVKAAMGCQLADELASGFGLRAAASQHCVDVLSDGYAFRLFLCSDRDQAMAAKLGCPEEAAQAGSPGGRLAAAASFPALQTRSAHHALMSALAGSAPAFPAAARLAHRWLAAQMLSNHICPEAAELLTAAVFSPGRGPPVPGTRLGGFMRFLDLIASLGDRRGRAIVVDPDRALADRAAAVASLAKAVREGTGPALGLITPYDPVSGAWTRHRPTTAIVRRAAALASRSLTLLQEHIEHGRNSRSALRAAIFGPAIADFDALLLLRRNALPAADCAAQGAKALAEAARRRGFAAMDPGAARPVAEVPPPVANGGREGPDTRARAVLRAVPEEVLRKRGPERVARDLLVGFDPLSIYLAGLERRFDGVATFCADALGGPLIGVKWGLQARGPHELAVQVSHAMRPAAAAAAAVQPPAKRGRKAGKREGTAPDAVDTAAAAVKLVELDAAAALEDMRAMGAGLVEDVWLKGPAA